MKSDSQDKPYCIHIPKHWYSTEQRIWEGKPDEARGSGLWEFVRQETWEYSFDKETVKDRFNDGFEREALPLSRMALGHLLIAQNTPFEEFALCGYNAMNVKHGEEETLLHFDVMHNWRPGNDKNRIGYQALEADLFTDLQELKRIYHTIGNFAPIPWPENLQRVHANNSERWDKLLLHLQANWSSWKDITFSFKAYMKATCQQMYFKKIVQEATSPEVLSANEPKLLKCLEKWNEQIDNQKAGEIISFDGNAESDSILVKNNLNLIKKLIELRGRCILAVLKNSQPTAR